MLRKAKLCAILGITFIIQAVSCLVLFCVTVREKKSLAGAFWALCVAFGTAGGVLLAIYKNEEKKHINRTRKRLAERDHWFHNFEYPVCAEPSINIDETYIEPVETEEDFSF